MSANYDEYPAFVIDEVRVASEVGSGDARIRCELCTRHLRVEITATWCDDADDAFETRESLYPLDSVVAWCRTLADGEDHVGYRNTFSLDSHVRADERDPAQQCVWFYPMTEDRLCLGLAVGPSIPALRTCLAWARANLAVVDAEVRADIGAAIDTCLGLLDLAERRVGARERVNRGS